MKVLKYSKKRMIDTIPPYREAIGSSRLFFQFVPVVPINQKMGIPPGSA